MVNTVRVNADHGRYEISRWVKIVIFQDLNFHFNA